MATSGWIETIALVAAILFGSAGLASASWVWLSRRVFGYAGLTLSAAGVILIAIAAWPSSRTVAGSSQNGDASASLQPVERKLATLEQSLSRLETALQAASKPVNVSAIGDLKQTMERLEGHAARFSGVDALAAQVSGLQESSRAQVEVLTQELADFGEQTRARLIALQAALDRGPSIARPVPAAAPVAAPRPPASPSPPRRQSGTEAARSMDNSGPPGPAGLPAIIEPAAGPAGADSVAWGNWLSGRDAKVGTEGAEGPR